MIKILQILLNKNRKNHFSNVQIIKKIHISINNKNLESMEPTSRQIVKKSFD